MSYPEKVRQLARIRYLQGESLKSISQDNEMPTYENLYKWRSEDNWDNELEIVEGAVKKKADEIIANIPEQIVKMNKEHLVLLEAARARVAERLREGVEPVDLLRVMKSLDITIKSERLIRGEVTDRQENQHQGEFKVDGRLDVKQSREELLGVIKQKLAKLGQTESE